MGLEPVTSIQDGLAQAPPIEIKNGTSFNLGVHFIITRKAARFDTIRNHQKAVLRFEPMPEAHGVLRLSHTYVSAL